MKHNYTIRERDAESGEALGTTRVSNTICEGFYFMLTRLASKDDQLTHSDLSFQLDIGDGDVTTPQFGDASLGSRFATVDVTDFEARDTALFVTTFVDSTEANGDGGGSQDITEMGVRATEAGGATYLCNRTAFAALEKTPSKTITVDTALDLTDDPNDP